MIRYLFYAGAILLILDHIYTHWGPEIINGVAGKFVGRQVEIVKEAPYRQSIIDKVIKAIVDRLEHNRR